MLDNKIKFPFFIINGGAEFVIKGFKGWVGKRVEIITSQK